MPEIMMSETNAIDHPQAEAIADRVYRMVRLAGERALAHLDDPGRFPLQMRLGSFEDLFLRALTPLRARLQRPAIDRVCAALVNPAARHAGNGGLAGVDLKNPEVIEAQLRRLPFPRALRFTPATANGHLSAQPPGAAALMRRRADLGTSHWLGLRLQRLQCVSETDEWGEDEIYLAGVAITPDGRTRSISAFKVGDFSDGEVQRFTPPREFARFQVLDSRPWPQSYFVTFVLTEKDFGGLNEFLDKLVDKVRDEVASALTIAVGGTIGWTGGPLGAAVGAAIGWVVGKIFDLFSVWIGDDIFMPVTVRTRLGSMNARYDGRPVSSERRVWWKGHGGGHYKLWYDWRRYEQPRRAR